VGAARRAQVMLKAAEGTSVADRARVATLALACVCLAQGVAFFHAGDEILRSKSLDRDSYNSGAPAAARSADGGRCPGPTLAARDHVNTPLKQRKAHCVGIQMPMRISENV